MLKSLSPIDVALIKKIGGNGSSYTLPIASSTQLGGVQPVAKTDTMTQSVGVDESGALWTAPGGGGGSTDEWELIQRVTLEDNVFHVIFTPNFNDYNEFAVFGRSQAYDVANDALYTSSANTSTCYCSAGSFAARNINLGGSSGPLGFIALLKKYGDYYYLAAITANQNAINNGDLRVANTRNFVPGNTSEISEIRFTADTSTNRYYFSSGSIFEFWGKKK